MTDGSKLYVTAHYAFDYSKGHLDHLYQFDVLTQFFEFRQNLKGFISDKDGDRVEEGSEVALLMDSLYNAFDRKDIPELVNKLLHEYEMYEILDQYISPLEGEALRYKEDLLKAKNI